MNREELKAEIKRLSANRSTNLLEQTVKLLHDNCPGWNWVGIYLLVNDELRLGPFQGAPTEHDRIAIGTGVCGSAVKEQRNILVDDVSKRDNYLACSLETKSELVVLIRHDDRIVGQFDIDGHHVAAFSAEDELFLQELACYVSEQCMLACKQLC